MKTLNRWTDQNPKVLKRIIKLCIETCKNPTAGVGKPEPLRFEFSGYRSRRITQEHRPVYAFDNQEVTVI